jgi:acetaldehyde dehydrogenase (acetylating)
VRLELLSHAFVSISFARGAMSSKRHCKIAPRLFTAEFRHISLTSTSIGKICVYVPSYLVHNFDLLYVHL